MKGVGIVIIIVGIILIVAVYQGGFEGVKENPLESTIDSVQSIYGTGKNVVDYAQGDNNTELTEVGMIPCATNEDCAILDGCEDNACQCYDNGVCYR